jgi:hypothetical protein
LCLRARAPTDAANDKRTTLGNATRRDHDIYDIDKYADGHERLE